MNDGTGTKFQKINRILNKNSQHNGKFLMGLFVIQQIRPEIIKNFSFYS